VDELAWALHNATIVEQGARMLAAGSMGGLVRDESMARNVGWILERHPDARIVLWAHNGHVARAPGSMGSHLSRAFGDDYVVIGFATASGTYTAVDRGRGVVRDNELQPPPEGSVEAVLHATETPRLVLDLDAAEAADPASGFLARPTPFRSIGALSMEQQFFPANVALAYDALVWIAQTSASREMR
jgi:erythromycin esterase